MNVIPGEKKEIILSIRTAVIDPEQDMPNSEDILAMMKRIVDGENVGDDEINNLIGEEEPSEMELCTEAIAEINKDGCVEISYYENEDDDVLKTLSKIIFSQNDPSLVVMTKEGAMRAILSFEEGKTHICTYDTPFMPIKVYVTASRVDNRLLSDGYLKLCYVLILNDTPPQHFTVDIKAKETASDPLKEIFS